MFARKFLIAWNASENRHGSSCCSCTCTTAVWFLVCIVSISLYAEDFLGPVFMEAYTQEIKFVFSSSSAAQSAEIGMLPLYNGYEWAFSSWWDDNNFRDPSEGSGNIYMHEVLSRAGHKGTFCLTGDEGRGITATLARSVLPGGFSFSVHTLTHNWISYCNLNRIHEEIAGCRAFLEAIGNTTVNGFNHPGANWYERYRNGNKWIFQEAAEGHQELLLRSGLYHFFRSGRVTDPQQRFSTMHTLGGDGKLFTPEWPNNLNSIQQDSALKASDPAMTMGVHATYTGSQWDWFEDTLTKYAGNPAWWYCNHNEYAAYRYQYRYSTLTSRQSDDTVHVTLRRPLMTQLNDTVPLTIAVTGAAPETIQNVWCATAVSSAASSPGTYHVYHDDIQALPRIIGLVRNSDNPLLNRPNTTVDAEIPGVEAVLRYSRDSLYLAVDNVSGFALSNVRINYRVPLAFKDEPELRREPDIAAGGSLSRGIALRRVTNDYLYTVGMYYFHAQIDFVRDGIPQRLYAQCRWENPHIDYSFAQGGFLMYKSATADANATWAALTGGTFPLSNFQKFSDPVDVGYYTVDTHLRRTFNSPDLFGSGGGNNTGLFVRSLLYSSEEQEVTFMYDTECVLNIAVDGTPAAATPTVTLSKGYHTLDVWCHNSYLTFFCAVSPETDARAKNLWFLPVTATPVPSGVACRDIPALYTDAGDTVRVEAWLVDDSGHIVPHIEESITFSIGAGGAWADGTTANKTVPVVNALASIGVRATGSGPVTVTASYGTLPAGTATVYPRSGYVSSIRHADMRHGADIRIRQLTNGIEFCNIPSKADLTVLSLSGRRVFTLSDETGSGTIRIENDNSAALLPPRGMYLYSITDKVGSRQTGKFLIR